MGTANFAIRISIVLFMFVSGCLGYDPADRPVWDPGDSEAAQVQPLRILFVIDNSQSMIITDPAPQGRVRATEEIVWDLSSDPETEFGLISFSGQATGLTGSPDKLFTRDRGLLTQALAALGEAGGNTCYESALLLAEQAIEQRMLHETHRTLATASYHVVFLSDGHPYPVDYDDDINTPDRIHQLVGQIAWLGEQYGVGDLKLHFAYLSSGAPESIAQTVAALHRELADKGRGQYLEFASGREIDFSEIEFR